MPPFLCSPSFPFLLFLLLPAGVRNPFPPFSFSSFAESSRGWRQDDDVVGTGREGFGEAADQEEEGIILSCEWAHRENNGCLQTAL